MGQINEWGTGLANIRAPADQAPELNLTEVDSMNPSLPGSQIALAGCRSSIPYKARQALGRVDHYRRRSPPLKPLSARERTIDPVLLRTLSLIVHSRWDESFLVDIYYLRLDPLPLGLEVEDAIRCLKF